ncbi:hypothetical protein D1007_17165 [Hordeum vulgare]|nr:hypothetical protein D1007_17165 [Hordeum vulgare]
MTRRYPTLPPSHAPSFFAVPPSPVHYTMTIGEASGHSMDMVRDEQFREAQADAAYNHHLLQEHMQDDEEEGETMFGLTNDEVEDNTEAAPNEVDTFAGAANIDED